MTLNVITISSAGLIRGFLVFLSFDWVSLTQPSELPARLLSSTATTLFWLLLISILVEDSRSFKDQFNLMFSTSILKYSKDIENPSINVLRNKDAVEFKGIENILNSVLNQTVRSAYDKETLIRAAVNVRLIVDDIIRPLSHRLWINTNESVPKFRIKATIYGSIRHLRISPFAASIFLALPGLINLPIDFGFTRGLIGAATIALTTYSSFVVINKYVLTKVFANLVVNIVALLFSGFGVSLSVFFLNKFIFELEVSNFSFIFLVLVPLAGIISSIRENTKFDRDSILANMQSSLFGLDGRNEDEVTRENMASFLHNTLQSELIALSYQLENAATDPQSEESRALLERIGARINRSISEDFHDFLENPLKRLYRIKSAWSGIAQIDLNLPANLDLDAEKQSLFVQIVEEAINNAVRSGGAKRVDVEATLISDRGLTLTVKNDGKLDDAAIEGLGTQWLDSRVSGNWSRKIVDGFIVLEVTI